MKTNQEVDKYLQSNNSNEFVRKASFNSFEPKLKTFEEKCNYWFLKLSEKEKIHLIETCMPMCGVYRTIEQNIFTDGMYENFLKEHTKNIKWELHEYIDTVDGHFKIYHALGYDEKDREYKCIAEVHSCNEIIPTEIEPTFN